MATIQILQVPLVAPLSSSSSSTLKSSSPLLNNLHVSSSLRSRKHKIGSVGLVVFASNQESEVSLSTTTTTTQLDKENENDPQILEYVSQVKRVLELLKKNRDMEFFEVKLTIMIEDPRDVERRRLLGIDDESAPTRDDLAAVLDEGEENVKELIEVVAMNSALQSKIYTVNKLLSEYRNIMHILQRLKTDSAPVSSLTSLNFKINEGKIPEDHVSLQILAEELSSWPNLEVESLKNTKKAGKSLYAKATDTGVDPLEAAKRLNIDWDTAAEIEDAGSSDDTEVPKAVGYGALYLVTAFPVIIGISVVLILFYNSLQ